MATRAVQGADCKAKTTGIGLASTPAPQAARAARGMGVHAAITAERGGGRDAVRRARGRRLVSRNTGSAVTPARRLSEGFSAVTPRV